MNWGRHLGERTGMKIFLEIRLAKHVVVAGHGLLEGADPGLDLPQSIRLCFEPVGAVGSSKGLELHCGRG